MYFFQQMPVLTPIPGGFMHGKIIRIQGAVSHSAQRYVYLIPCQLLQVEQHVHLLMHTREPYNIDFIKLVCSMFPRIWNK